MQVNLDVEEAVCVAEGFLDALLQLILCAS